MSISMNTLLPDILPDSLRRINKGMKQAKYLSCSFVDYPIGKVHLRSCAGVAGKSSHIH